MIGNTSMIIFSSFLVSLIVVPTSWGGTDCKNIAGTWTIVEKLTKTTCSDEWKGKQYTERITIHQNDCIAAVEGTRVTFDMTSGAIRGSYPEQDGTTKIKSGSLDLDNLTGSWTWSFSGPGENCRGSSNIKLTR